MKLFGCQHSKTTTPRRDVAGNYVRCLECGGRLPWAWRDKRRLKPPQLKAPRLEKEMLELERIAGLRPLGKQ